VTVHYLYRILVPDGRAYIGRSKSPRSRFSTNCGAASGIGQAIQRHGSDNCVFQILCAGPEDYIKDLENRAILKFNTLYPAGYNNARSDKSYQKRKKLMTPGPGDWVPVNEFPDYLDAIFGPCTSPQTLSNCGSVEMTANTEGRRAIERIFPGWVFAWRQAGFPWVGWRSSVLHLPSLAANCANTLPPDLVKLKPLQAANDNQLSFLMASAAEDQGVRSAWFTIDHKERPSLNFLDGAFKRNPNVINLPPVRPFA
jgi:hypothetical protein